MPAVLLNLIRIIFILYKHGIARRSERPFLEAVVLSYKYYVVSIFTTYHT